MTTFRKIFALGALCCTAIVATSVAMAAVPCDKKTRCDSAAQASLVQNDGTKTCSGVEATSVSNTKGDCASQCSGAQATTVSNTNAGCDQCPVSRAMASLTSAVKAMDAIGGSNDCSIRTDVLAAMGELEMMVKVMEQNPQLAQSAAAAFVSYQADCASKCSGAKATTVSNTAADCASKCSGAKATTVSNTSADCASKCSGAKATTVSNTDKSCCSAGTVATKATTVSNTAKSCCSAGTVTQATTVSNTKGDSAAECSGAANATFVAYDCTNCDRIARAAAKAYMAIMVELKNVAGVEGCPADNAQKTLAALMTERAGANAEVKAVSLGAVSEKKQCSSTGCSSKK